MGERRESALGGREAEAVGAELGAEVGVLELF